MPKLEVSINSKPEAELGLGGRALVLASSSPRRQQFLTELGLEFTTTPADIDETPHKGEAPLFYVQRVAQEKVLKVAMAYPSHFVLGADCSVCVGRIILGKPENEGEAAAMLKLLSGRRHRVITTVVLASPYGGRVFKTTTQTIVKMRPLTPMQVAAYVAAPKNWQGYAGGYALQTGQGGALVQWVRGSVSGVVGLPLAETVNLLRQGGYNV